MELKDTDILYASLVGSKIVKEIPRLTAVQNELMKHVIPPINFLPFTRQTGVNSNNGSVVSEDELWKSNPSTPKEDQFFPLEMSIDDGITWFMLPYEPLISVNGKNNITRRKVAKAKNLEGTVKEHWSRGDYDITITGVLLGDKEVGDVAECFPKEDFESLKQCMTAAKSIQVKCEILQLSGINNIVIEDFSWPFTKGENVQAYEIKAYSDSSFKLLLDIED
ncbi:hypothetical protein FHR24_001502 [Wenyingzhuangia heitensis]|uniref:DUF6046 domain-containing protein n=1 Tax=Wenyingzhuangia heitensis TaxID=1487859 RepID=A0ABX0U9Z2_9FLAO|nr:DUF6046 domain-containing protein [Wenyingzhuangia heitensis]NIJ45063.1 hypothetical protein [Wenyingzhuangia heitensis]